YTPASPDYSPASDTEFDLSEDLSSDHIPPLPATSPFLSSTDDSSDSDIPDTPPSPTHGTPFTKTTLSTQRSPTASGALRHHFSSDDSSSSSSSSSSSETSSDSSADALSDSASSRSSSDHSLPSITIGVVQRIVLTISGLGVNFEDESSEPSRSRGTDLEMDVDVERSDGIEIDPEVQAEIDECIAYADALRDRGIDARVVVEAIDQEEIETGMRGPVEREIENRFDVVDSMTTMSNTRSRASRTREGINEQSDRLMAEALRVRDAVRNLRPLMGDKGEQEVNENGGNGNGGNRNRGNGNRGNENRENGNGNGNRREYGYNFRGFMPARKYIYQDFLKCQPLNFNGTKGVVGLTRWFEKMETIFYISNCPEKYQVKYASCMLLNSALTWWNSHKRTIGIEACLCHELDRNYEVDDRSVLSKKQGPKDGDRVVELGCERKLLD
ncbi:hypothetical protein Tco_0764843, partial [Tanacetum coccineum]